MKRPGYQSPLHSSGERGGMTKREIRQIKRAVLALAAVVALVLTASALGDDFSQGKGATAAPNWKVLTPGPAQWHTQPAETFADGIGFAFGTDNPYPKLFLTSHPGSGLLGNLTGKTLTATFAISGTATAFTYFKEGEPDNDGLCGTPAPASVRLYFEGNTNSENNHQWWSTPQASSLTSLVGTTLMLTVPLDTANWSDKVGRPPVPRPASDVPTDFADAVATVGAVGVSFGGGCITYAFAGGVAPTDGTASFVLKSYSAS
jgi:hypothetical protein